MNITDFIVEYLQQGHSVEIPSVGTLSVMGDRITLRQTFCNDKSIVKLIAEKECVSESIADMMWKNYVDALTDKLKRSGSHKFDGVGVMSYNNGVYSFSSSLEKVTIEDTLESKVVGNVTKYTKSEDEADPFNVFEQPINENITGIQGVTPIEEKPIEEKPIEEKPIEENPIEEKPIEEKPIEKKPIEEKPIEEKPIEEKPIEEKPIEEKPIEEKPIEAKPIEEEPIKHEYQKEEIHHETKEPYEEGKQDAIDKFEKVVSPVMEKPKAKDTSRERMRELDDIHSATSNPEPKKKTKKEGKSTKKNKKRAWLWIIIILLLLCIGGGAYYYFCVYNKSDSIAVGQESLVNINDIPVENDFTYNADLIEFSDEEHLDEVVKVCAFMDEYIGNFLAARGYGYAKDQMMERVEQYATARMDTLLSTNKYSVRRFVPYEDYLYNTCIPTLKRQKAQGARVEIQIELMELSILDDILHSMILDLNLKSEFQTVKRVAVHEEQPATPKVTMVKNSKQGFDIIAGFYTSRTSATRMTYVLKNQGCDAYVVEKNNGYYVSMGSASTRTAAEALMKHIKSWYDGDVVIKKID